MPAHVPAYTPPYILYRLKYFVGGHLCCNTYAYPWPGGTGGPPIADTLAETWWTNFGTQFANLCSQDAAFLLVETHIHDGVAEWEGTYVIPGDVHGGQIGHSLPPKDVLVMQRHLEGGGYYGGPLGHSHVLGHSYISGLDETQVDGGIVIRAYRDQWAYLFNFGIRLAFDRERMWSPKFGYWLGVVRYVPAPLVKVLRRRSKPSS